MNRWLLVLTCVISLAGCSSSELPSPSTPPKLAPHFELRNLQGLTVSTDQWQGQWVVLNIWATWCPPCVREIPGFIELQDEMAAKGVQFVGIAIDEKGIETVGSFAERVRFNYPVLLGSMEFIRDYFGQINAIPTTFIITPDWVIVDQITGSLDKDTLGKIIRDFQAGKRAFQSSSQP